MMTIARAFWEGSTVTGSEYDMPIVFDQCKFAFQQIYKLVLVRVPMALAGPGS
jgi:hypothetical protein